MLTSPRETVLCRYHYDALDRLDNSAPSAMDSLQRFYCKTRLATEIQGSVRNSIFQHEDQLLAQQRHENARIDSSLLATDQQRSVLNSLSATEIQPATYTPYGHRSPENGLLSLLGFNGERRDPLTGHYPLGNGYRQFNPVSMRFNSPDSLSPFGDGGLNAYAYCEGDPVNRSDPTGHVALLKKVIGASVATIVGATAASYLVEDETVGWVLTGVSFVAGAIVGGAIGLKVRQSMRRRPQRSSVAPRQPEVPMQELTSARRSSQLPPSYWSDQPRPAPPAYDLGDLTLPGSDSLPPPYSVVADSNSVTRALQPSLPNQSLTRSLSNEHLSTSTSSIDQSARRVRNSI